MSGRDEGKKQRDESLGYPTFGYTTGTMPSGVRKGERRIQKDVDENKGTCWKWCCLLLIGTMVGLGIMILLSR